MTATYPDCVQGAQMGDEVAVAEAQFGLEVGERPTHARGQQRHDGESAAFVDDLVDLVEVQGHGVRSAGDGFP